MISSTGVLVEYGREMNVYWSSLDGLNLEDTAGFEDELVRRERGRIEVDLDVRQRRAHWAQREVRAPRAGEVRRENIFSILERMRNYAASM